MKKHKNLTSFLIRQLIGKNVKEFNLARDHYTNAVKAEAEAWMLHIFQSAQQSEERVVRSYVDKINQLCDKLDGIDPSDDDYSPQEVDLILSHISKLQELVAKIAGTEATRDVSIFKSKTEIKANLMPTTGPALPNVTPIGSEKKTKFID